LSAISGITGLPVTGSFLPTSIVISTGVGSADPVYTIAEPISIQITDNTPSTAQGAPTQPKFSQQGTINVHPGPLATIDGIADFQMQSNEERTFNLVLRDVSGNPIPGQKLTLSVQGGDPSNSIALNGQTGVITIPANGQGELSLRFQPSVDTNGKIQIMISDADVPNGYSTFVVANVLGLSRRPSAAPELGANRIPVNSKLPLNINLSVSAGGTIRTYYRLDGGAWQTYDPAVGAVGFTETKNYTVEWYSEVCYDSACTNPVNELSINGSPNLARITTYVIDNSISGYPSPFNPKGPDGENYITLQYPLAQASSVEINIYDLMGQKVWHKNIDAGQEGGQGKTDNRVFWFGTNDNGMVVANGGYITTVKVGTTGQMMKTKILVVK
jgi:hypothetical protein